GVDREEAVSALSMALFDPSPRVRETAASILKEAGPAARPAVPFLIRALKDPSRVVRWRAVESLGVVVGRDAAGREARVPALVGALKDRSPDVRIEAAFTLAVMGRGEPAIPVLSAAAHEGHDAAGLAALGLGLCGSSDPVAVEALTRAARGSFYSE